MRVTLARVVVFMSYAAMAAMRQFGQGSLAYRVEARQKNICLMFIAFRQWRR